MFSRWFWRSNCWVFLRPTASNCQASGVWLEPNLLQDWFMYIPVSWHGHGKFPFLMERYGDFHGLCYYVSFRSSNWWKVWPLVGGFKFQPTWNILHSQHGESSRGKGENKTYLKPPPSSLLNSWSQLDTEIKTWGTTKALEDAPLWRNWTNKSQATSRSRHSRHSHLLCLSFPYHMGPFLPAAHW